MAIIPKINIQKTAGLVGGAVAARKVGAVVPVQNETVKKAIPVVLGLVLSGQRGELIKGLGDGMIAQGGADLLGSFVPGISGISEDVLMGSTDFEDYSSDSYDTTSSEAGEMNF